MDAAPHPEASAPEASAPEIASPDVSSPDASHVPPMPSPPATPHPTFGEALRTWLRIGCLGFGGPAGQIALMHRTVVDEKRWVDDARFLHALNYCTLLPGPEAQQLATYVGWLLHRTAGGIAAGTLFVLPGFCVVMALSFIYAAYKQIPAIDALFWGLKPAVLAVVLEALLRVGRRSLRDGFSLALAGGAFAALFAFGVPFPAVVFGAGLLGWLRARYAPATSGGNGANGHKGHKGGTTPHAPARGENPPAHLPLPAIRDMPDHARPSTARALRVLATWLPLWLGPVLLLGLLLGWDNVYARMGVFFSKMAVVTFGGAYAVLAYVAQQAVEAHGWLTAADMLGGLALAESTPGPLILVLQFVGYLAAWNSPGALPPALAGLLGATLTVWVTFTPCFLWIFLGAPYIEAVRGRPALAAALAGVTAAVAGVIANLSLWFGLHVLFGTIGAWEGPLGLRLPMPVLSSLDPVAALLAVGAGVAMLRFKAPMLPVLAVCAGLGAVIRLAL
nr:chromate efflux transporter [Nitratidesulfovibrio sp. SRB-5]